MKKLLSPRCYATLLSLIFIGCAGAGEPLPDLDFRQDMRTLVIEIAEYARSTSSGFIVVPQNGEELITIDGEHDGAIARAYVDAIDGQGREDLFYGYNADDRATPEADSEWMTGFLDRVIGEGVVPLVTDYVSTESSIDDAYAKNGARGYVAYAADSRELDTIAAYPASPVGESTATVVTLSDAANFLYLINPGAYASPGDLVAALDATNYDVFIVDAFFDDSMLTPSHVAALRTKPGGAARLVLAYFSIGEAEDYRYYWQSTWRVGEPGFLQRENPDWPGNYKVRYWDPEWKAILFGSESAYLDRIVAAGFDGVYLDIIDAYEYFE